MLFDYEFITYDEKKKPKFVKIWFYYYIYVKWKPTIIKIFRY